MGYYIYLRGVESRPLCFVPGTLERAINEATRLWDALQDKSEYESRENLAEMHIDFNPNGDHGLEIAECLQGDERGKTILTIDYTTHER